jgi:hypothetical protein
MISSKNFEQKKLHSRQPHSSAIIDTLLQSLEDSPPVHTISCMGGLLQQSPTVRVLHHSLSDSLTRKRSVRAGLDAVLERNVCNMTLITGHTTESLPDNASYACVFYMRPSGGCYANFGPLARLSISPLTLV